MSKKKSPVDPFGTWKMGTSDTAHYHLEHVALCVSLDSDPGGTEPPRSKRGHYLTKTLCPTCLELNIERWKRAG